MEITRRSFLAGIGAVSVGLLFHRKLDRVLESLERDLVAEQQAPDQQPSAAEIVVMPDVTFRPKRLVIPLEIAPLFVIEDIRINRVSQFVGSAAIPAEIFTPDAVDAIVGLDAAAAGTEMCFRVRYVGKDPRGARFTAALLGITADGSRRILPIDSHVAIVS